MLELGWGHVEKTLRSAVLRFVQTGRHMTVQPWRVAMLNATGRLVASAFLGVVATAAHATEADASKLAPANRLFIERLDGKALGKRAKDISGIACMQPVAGRGTRCLVINDENQSAQFVEIRVKGIAALETVRLVANHAPVDVIGREPKIDCPNGRAAFEEFDGEAVAFSAPYFYVVGSHGCSRSRGKFRLSSFLVARFRVDAAGNVIDRAGRPVTYEQSVQAIEASYRLADALRSLPEIKDYLGKDVNNANGLNIEGAVVVGERLLVGLRGPAQNGQVILVAVSIAELFAPGGEPLPLSAQLMAINLTAQPTEASKRQGVRDLAVLPNGKLLVLAGPAQEQAGVPYSLYMVEPHDGAKAQVIVPALGGIKDKAKAEAVHVIAATPKELRLLVMFDGEPDGAPAEYRVALPRH